MCVEEPICEWGQRQRISASNAMEILLLPILLLLLVSDAYFDGDDGSDGYDDANPQHKQVTHLTSLSDSVCLLCISSSIREYACGMDELDVPLNQQFPKDSFNKLQMI